MNQKICFGKILALVLTLMMAMSLPARAQEYVNPVFVGVERVNIVVRITPSTALTEGAQESLPEPLRKASLEKMLKEIYTERFKGHKIGGTVRGTYGRNNQPVHVLNFDDGYGDRLKIYKQSIEPGTLTVFFQGTVTRADDARSAVDSDIFSYQITNFRYGITSSIQQQIHAPRSVTLSLSEERIGKLVRDYIKGRID